MLGFRSDLMPHMVIRRWQGRAFTGLFADCAENGAISRQYQTATAFQALLARRTIYLPSQTKRVLRCAIIWPLDVQNLATRATANTVIPLAQQNC
ncbi:hypothetical protein KCP70_16995 [Salmonella enterica subsp. enterica]|nr:hypothetical protein KCP70_16995 [Salmonella enterica subsp. enterica]